MVRALLLLFALPLLALAEDPAAKKPALTLARQLTILHETKLKSFGTTSIKDMTLTALKDKLEREFADDEFRLIIREDQFRLHYPDKEAYGQEKFKLDLRPNGMTVRDFLTVALADINAVYLVRNRHIEITTPLAALSECAGKTLDGTSEKAAEWLRRTPLVSYHADGLPLGEAVKAVSARYGKAVIFDPAVGEERSKLISPSWTNVPFPKAVQLLAAEAGLEAKTVHGVLIITKPGRNKKRK